MLFPRRRRALVYGGGAPAVPAWLALGPAWSLRPVASQIVTSGADVTRLTDEVTGGAGRVFEQAGSIISYGAVPKLTTAFAGNVPALDCAGATVGLARLDASGPQDAYSAQCTGFALCSTGSLAATAFPFATTFSSASTGFRITSGGRLDGVVQGMTMVGGTEAAMTPVWQMLKNDANVARSLQDSAGGSTSAAGIAPGTYSNCTLGSAASGSSISQPFDGLLAWWFGYDRILTAPEVALVVSDIENYRDTGGFA